MDRETLNNIIFLVVSGILATIILITLIYLYNAIKNNKDTKTGLPKKDKSNKKESNFNLNKVSLKFTDMNDVTVDKAVDDHNFKLLDDFEKLSQEDELKFNEIMNKNKKSFKDLRKNK